MLRHFTVPIGRDSRAEEDPYDDPHGDWVEDRIRECAAAEAAILRLYVPDPGHRVVALADQWAPGRPATLDPRGVGWRCPFARPAPSTTPWVSGVSCGRNEVPVSPEIALAALLAFVGALAAERVLDWMDRAWPCP